MFYKKKVVVITGATSGIGLALARHLASEGANLVLGARRYVDLCQIAQELEAAHGIRAVAVACDVSVEEDCKQLIAQAMMTFKRIDILINNAGVSMRATFDEVALQVLRRLMDVNFWGTVYCTKYALPELLKSKGSLVAVSSIAGYRGLPGRSGYSASKFAIHGFLESLRVENLYSGLHVLLACPGFTASHIRQTAYDKDGKQTGETNMDEGKMMKAELVAKRIAKAMAKRQRTLVLTTQGKLAVFFNKWIPAWVDKKVYKLFAN
ncbi:SDR family oxidoreductase [Olivibacter sitiensis]|uniref:SDR family oxidoreductase n=1 Tax=Olivibacter sitiensis TaxID=376470 RepID=UPI0004181C22|nr:SDR family oxidoreductase [Olivibacter sitiensis]